LRLAIVEQREIFLFQVFDKVALSVLNNDVELHQARFGTQDGLRIYFRLHTGRRLWNWSGSCA
jgi:hypothetical protein